MVDIREATPGDIPVLSTLFDSYRQFYDMPSDPALAHRFISERMTKQQSAIFVAERGMEIVGFCQIYFSFCSVFAAPICILNDLFVTPSGRGSGAGKALLKVAEMFALRTGAVRITLQTAKTNERARALYETHGWTRNTTLYGYAKRLG